MNISCYVQLTDWARHLGRARQAGPRLVSPTPRIETRMSDISNFSAQLAIAGNGFLRNKRDYGGSVRWTDAAENAFFLNI